MPRGNTCVQRTAVHGGVQRKRSDIRSSPRASPPSPYPSHPAPHLFPAQTLHRKKHLKRGLAHGAMSCSAAEKRQGTQQIDFVSHSFMCPIQTEIFYRHQTSTTATKRPPRVSCDHWFESHDVAHAHARRSKSSVSICLTTLVTCNPQITQMAAFTNPLQKYDHARQNENDLEAQLMRSSR